MMESANTLFGEVRVREEGELAGSEKVSPAPDRVDVAPDREVGCSAEPLFGTTDKYRLSKPLLRDDDLTV